MRGGGWGERFLTEHEFAPYVGRCAVVLLEDSHRDIEELRCEWHCKLSVLFIVRTAQRLIGLFGLEPVQFRLNTPGFFTMVPDIGPVLLGFGVAAGSHKLEDELGWVLGFTAVTSSIPFEVVEHDL